MGDKVYTHHSLGLTQQLGLTFTTDEGLSSTNSPLSVLLPRN